MATCGQTVLWPALRQPTRRDRRRLRQGPGTDRQGDRPGGVDQRGAASALPIAARQPPIKSPGAVMRNRWALEVAAAFGAGMLFAGAAALAQDQKPMATPFVQVPGTVSAEARRYLESLPDPATLPAWP